MLTVLTQTSPFVSGNPGMEAFAGDEQNEGGERKLLHRPQDTKALEQAGIHFTDDEAGEIGVRLRIGNR
jgi:hypothetical protein